MAPKQIEMSKKKKRLKMEAKMRSNKINKRRKEGVAVTQTSTAVMLLPWIFMTAVWMKSKPEPVTTMFRPPLPKTKQSTVKKTLVCEPHTAELVGETQEDKHASYIPPGLILTKMKTN